jgi:hypothetical protein
LCGCHYSIVTGLDPPCIARNCHPERSEAALPCRPTPSRRPKDTEGTRRPSIFEPGKVGRHSLPNREVAQSRHDEAVQRSANRRWLLVAAVGLGTSVLIGGSLFNFACSTAAFVRLGASVLIPARRAHDEIVVISICIRRKVSPGPCSCIERGLLLSVLACISDISLIVQNEGCSPAHHQLTAACQPTLVGNSAAQASFSLCKGPPTTPAMISCLGTAKRDHPQGLASLLSGLAVVDTRAGHQQRRSWAPASVRWQR